MLFFIYNLFCFFLILFSFSVATSRSLLSFLFLFFTFFNVLILLFSFSFRFSSFFKYFCQKRQNPLQQLVSYSHCLQFLQSLELFALNYNHFQLFVVAKCQFKTTFAFYCFILCSTKIFWKWCWIDELINKDVLFKKLSELC